MTNKSASLTAFCSSLKDDVWHDVRGPGAFEGWHFDMISDDEDEALIVEFYDNYVLSPKFYELAHHSDERAERVPVASLIYYSKRQVQVGAVNEFVHADLTASGERFSLGTTCFEIERKPYGDAITLSIDLASFGGRRIKGEVEWLMVESDLAELPTGEHEAIWNLTAPRADVSGKIEVIGKLGKTRRSIHLRGTGFHDHIISRDVHYKDLRSRMWGRAHFSDATVVFERHGGVQNPSEPGRFFIIRDGRIVAYHSACHATEHRRNVFGLNVPRRIAYLADDGTRVRIKPYAAIRSDFCEVKMLAQVGLTLEDGKTREAVGLTEFVDPSRLASGLVRRVSDLRIGKKGRAGLF